MKAAIINMPDDGQDAERQVARNMNTTFILRLIWDGEARLWRIVLKPATGDPPRLFADLEMAFLYIARFYTDHD